MRALRVRVTSPMSKMQYIVYFPKVSASRRTPRHARRKALHSQWHMTSGCVPYSERSSLISRGARLTPLRQRTLSADSSLSSISCISATPRRRPRCRLRACAPAKPTAILAIRTRRAACATGSTASAAASAAARTAGIACPRGRVASVFSVASAGVGLRVLAIVA